MRRKEVEKYIKRATNEPIKEQLSSDDKERVWKNIESAVITEKIQVKKKKQPIIRYSVISCAAACMVIVISIIVARQYILVNPKPIIGDSTLNTNNSYLHSELYESNVSNGEATVVSSDKNRPAVSSSASSKYNYETLSKEIVVINHRLYQKKNDIQVFAKDIDKRYTEIIGGVADYIYSLYGKKFESALALKIDGVYQYYECVYDGVFSFNDKDYFLEDINQNGLNTYKGNYLGEAEGLKLYAFAGRDNAVLVDVSSLLGSGQAETLVAAVAQE